MDCEFCKEGIIHPSGNQCPFGKDNDNYLLAQTGMGYPTPGTTMRLDVALPPPGSIPNVIFDEPRVLAPDYASTAHTTAYLPSADIAHPGQAFALRAESARKKAEKLEGARMPKSGSWLLWLAVVLAAAGLFVILAPWPR